MQKIEEKILTLINEKTELSTFFEHTDIQHKINEAFEQLTRRPFGLCSREFIEQILIFNEDVFGHATTNQLWCMIEDYITAQRFPELTNNVESALERIHEKINNIFENNIYSGNKESGTYLLPRELANAHFIKCIYLSNDKTLINLFKHYLPTPHFSLFKGSDVPEEIALLEKTATNIIEKAKEFEPAFKQIQRAFRRKQRMSEEVNRITKAIPYYLKQEKLLAQDIIRDANTPYTPKKCSEKIAQRIVSAAEKIILFDTVKHWTSMDTIHSILDDALYGRRTLLQHYIPFRPAALMMGDIDSGDANVICMSAGEIDPSALQAGTCELVFDLDKLMHDHPVAFFKQRDLGYDNKKIRHVNMQNKDLFFTHTQKLRTSVAGYTPIQITNKCGSFQEYAVLPEQLFISYNIEKIHQILTLNFFRFLDNLHTINQTATSNITNDTYCLIEKLSDEELLIFLKNLGKQMSDTMEFNFYGAYQIELSAIQSISILNFSGTQDYTLNIAELIKELESGNTLILSEAKENVPQVFQSHRFMDYLLSEITHADSKKELESIRTMGDTSPAP